MFSSLAAKSIPSEIFVQPSADSPFIIVFSVFWSLIKPVSKVALVLYVTIPTLLFPVGLFAGLKILLIKSNAASCACSNEFFGSLGISSSILPETSITNITSIGLSGAVPVIDNSTLN